MIRKNVIRPVLSVLEIDAGVSPVQATAPGGIGLFMLDPFSNSRRMQVYRKFKPLFSPCATIPPAREAVNRAVFAKKLTLARGFSRP